MSQRSLRSAARKSLTPATINSSTDSSDSDEENLISASTTNRRANNTATRGGKSFPGRGRGKPKKKVKLQDFDPPPTPGSHPSEDDDMEATPMFVSPYLDDDGPPPTPGYSGGFDTVRLGASVPSLVSSSLTALMSNVSGLNMDQPPPTPCPIVHAEEDGRATPPIGSIQPPTPRTPIVAGENISSNTPFQIPMPSTSAHAGSSTMNLSQKSKGKGKPKTGSPVKIDYRAGVLCSMEEMIQNSILYFLLMQQRKIPVKRAEVVKHAMNGQSKDFKPLMEALASIFQEIFGISLVGLEGPKGGKPVQSHNYVLVSKYFMTLSDSVTYRPPEVHYKRTVLFLILSCIFMMNRSIEEDVVWKMMTDLNLDAEVGVKKVEDLRRYLKSEYVTAMYLAMEESKDSDVNIVRYSWGLRAEKEFSKYGILKFVAKQFPGQKPSDYAVQYGLALTEEKAAVEKDIADAAARAERGEVDVDPVVIPEAEEAMVDDEEDFLSTFDTEDVYASHKSTGKDDEDKKRRTFQSSAAGQSFDDSDDDETEEDSEDDMPRRGRSRNTRTTRSSMTRDNDDDASSNSKSNDGSDFDERMRFGTEEAMDESPPSPVL